MKPLLLALLFCCAGLAGTASAQEEVDVSHTVQVSTMRDPDWKPYRQMLLGLDAFERSRERAPGAELFFILRPQKAGVSIEGLTMRLAGRELSEQVPIDALGRFQLPRSEALVKDEADILLNRSKGAFRWRPDIHSPGVPQGMRRLGDLRMECEVRWAIEYEDLNFIKRNMFRAMGGPCNSSTVHVIQYHAQTLAKVTLVHGEKRAVVPMSRFTADGRGYVVPLHDKDWPDDTLIEFEVTAVSR